MTNSSLPVPSFRVGFDLDGVVYDFRRYLSEYLVSIGRPECRLEDALPHWDFFEGWGLTLNEYLDLYRTGVDAGYVLRVGAPLAGSVEAINRIAAAGHSIHIVTDRSVASSPGLPAQLTEAWLHEHRIPFDTLTMSADKTVVPTDFFIDDRYENYVSRVQAGLSCHLLNRTWNEGLGDATTRRVSSVGEFADAVIAAADCDTRLVQAG
jgi:hypothetical protein